MLFSKSISINSVCLVVCVPWFDLAPILPTLRLTPGFKALIIVLLPTPEGPLNIFLVFFNFSIRVSSPVSFMADISKTSIPTDEYTLLIVGNSFFLSFRSHLLIQIIGFMPAMSVCVINLSSWVRLRGVCLLP